MSYELVCGRAKLKEIIETLESSSKNFESVKCTEDTFSVTSYIKTPIGTLSIKKKQILFFFVSLLPSA